MCKLFLFADLYRSLRSNMATLPIITDYGMLWSRVVGTLGSRTTCRADEWTIAAQSTTAHCPIKAAMKVSAVRISQAIQRLQNYHNNEMLRIKTGVGAFQCGSRAIVAQTGALLVSFLFFALPKNIVARNFRKHEWAGSGAYSVG